MKKLWMMLAVLLCLTSCEMSSEDAIYSLKLTMLSSSFTWNGESEAKDVYAQIQDKLSTYTDTYIGDDDEWIVNITNGNFSSADKKAKARFDKAAKALDQLVEECKALIDGIPAGATGNFEIGRSLVLSRHSPGQDATLCEKNFSLSYPQQ